MKLSQLKRKYEKFDFGCGEKFGRLTLTGVSYIKQTFGHRGRIVEAVCQCGIVGNYWFHLLKNGETQSCGCLRKEISKNRMTTHNLSSHPLYDVHVKMIDRCYNPKSKDYKNYGGRGIEVWKDWIDFVCFYDWCMANGYEEGKSLDRKENDGFYSPQNCKFSTREEQNRNTRRNRMFTAFGETKCLFDWGKDSRCKISIWGLRNRMDRGKWTDFEKALTTPLEKRIDISRSKKNNRYLTAFGETKCFTAWLDDKRCLVKIDSLRDRLVKGWDTEKSISTPPSRDGKNSK